MTDSLYGRHRDSITDIEFQLYEIFASHPNASANESGEPEIPGDDLADALLSFQDIAGVELMTPSEVEQLQALLASAPGLKASPSMLVQFVAEKTKSSPPRTPTDEEEMDSRGRKSSRSEDEGGRSSSSDSVGTNYGQRGSSRPPSRGPPQTPTNSVFDSSRRQRSTPLNNPPTSFNKRPPPHRRKSIDNGSRSDSESFSNSPSSFGSRTSRARAPSNPTSPTILAGTFSPNFQTPSRPPSRQAYRNKGTHPGYSSPGDEGNYSSPDDEHDPTLTRGLNTLHMPSTGDDEDDDAYEGRIPDRRSILSSTTSLEPDERIEVFQRANEELNRKLREAEKSLQDRLAQHDTEIDEMTNKLEEMRTELNAAKREEKDLRAKEKESMRQIGALESEVAKVSKALEHARLTYSSLQKQYQEQCAASEKYREDLRVRDDSIRTLRDHASMYDLEASKWSKEQLQLEDRILSLERELEVTHSAQVQLDEQKQENLMLKETIDRMRFDMDEMRNNSSSAFGPSSGQSSAANTISKSLGAELKEKMGAWGGMEDEEEETVNEKDEDTEGEDVVQTIITRKKRKVASRANKIETQRFEELKEYSDSSTQYDPLLFITTASIQTEPEPQIPVTTISVQTDEIPVPKPVLPAPRVTMDMDIQTDAIPEREVSPSPPEKVASSSSAANPSPPKAGPSSLHFDHDQPPAYTDDDSPWASGVEVLHKTHPGAKIPTGALPNGVSEDAVADWKAIKEELGLNCLVIDKIIEKSDKNPPAGRREKSKSSRFYNIYNTYVVGNKNMTSLQSIAFHAVVGMAASAIFLTAAGPYMISQQHVPGGPTYYDRAAWSSFNSMQPSGEGFANDGAGAVWNFLGRVAGGAARTARGWPT